MSWTDERVERARTLWLEGWSAAQIAADLKGGLTRNAVIGKLTRLGLNRHGASAPTVAKPPRPVKPPRPPKPPKAPRQSRAPKAPIIDSWTRRGVPKAPDLRPVREAEARPVDPASLKTFAEKGRDECSWPIGAPDPVRGQLFCGQPTAFRKSYCACHGGPQVTQRRAYRVKDLGLAAERPIARGFAAECEVVDLVEAFR